MATTLVSTQFYAVDAFPVTVVATAADGTSTTSVQHKPDTGDIRLPNGSSTLQITARGGELTLNVPNIATWYTAFKADSSKTPSVFPASFADVPASKSSPTMAAALAPAPDASGNVTVYILAGPPIMLSMFGFTGSVYFYTNLASKVPTSKNPTLGLARYGSDASVYELTQPQDLRFLWPTHSSGAGFALLQQPNQPRVGTSFRALHDVGGAGVTVVALGSLAMESYNTSANLHRIFVFTPSTCAVTGHITAVCTLGGSISCSTYNKSGTCTLMYDTNMVVAGTSLCSAACRSAAADDFDKQNCALATSNPDWPTIDDIPTFAAVNVPNCSSGSGGGGATKSNNKNSETTLYIVCGVAGSIIIVLIALLAWMASRKSAA
jgi:hypothetical protein